ncbi:MAG: alpha/beta hydrolase [Selenomonadaceae bacterium]|nr:alpha/beta hydrolase [Selenomonadaceae bacterium]
MMTMGVSGQVSEAANKITNPFGLVYQNAITQNEAGRVNIRPVSYEVKGIKVAANLYLPADYDEASNKTYAAVTVAHPNGGSKEQVAGLYAQKLAELGYIALAADASFQGASGGEPRLRDYPANRIEDISGMVDYLSLLPKVDKNRIGSLGICGGGGYTLAAAQTDKRIKAVATLSMFNSGRVRRNGFLDADIAGIPKRLQKAAEARDKELRGEIVYEGFLPPNSTDDELRAKMNELPENTLYRDGIEYYGLTHRHPNATGSYTTESFMKLMAFDVEDRMDLIDQPLLMIAGEKADTLYMTNDAYAKSTGTENKELFLIEGASHIRTYWVPEYVDKAVKKLNDFYGKNL